MLTNTALGPHEKGTGRRLTQAAWSSMLRDGRYGVWVVYNVNESHQLKLERELRIRGDGRQPCVGVERYPDRA